MNWDDIDGFFDFDDIYEQQVQQAVDGAKFVEIGAWLGKSTAFMADAIRRSGKRIEFFTVDTWKGTSPSPDNGGGIGGIYALAASGSVKHLFTKNMIDCGVVDYVNPIECESVQAAQLFEDNSLDFVFIDADHNYEAVLADLRAWWPKVKTSGTLAGHDVVFRGPCAAVTEFAKEMRVPVNLHKISFLIKKSERQECRVLLAMPSYGTLDANTAMAGIAYPTANKVNVEVLPGSSSLLAHGFNQLWVAALANPNYTHFAMLHADIAPMAYWLDVFIDELKTTGADLISAVSPLKDDRGVTSCGIAHPTDWWTPKRRFTMSDIMSFPETFTADDAGYPGEPLLFNTGCWIADLRNPRWRTFDENGDLVAYFTINDKISLDENGRLVCKVQSEDWFFSAQLHKLGMKTMCTRKVQLTHYGVFGFPNYEKWGGWKVDTATETHWNIPRPKVVIREDLKQCQPV